MAARTPLTFQETNDLGWDRLVDTGAVSGGKAVTAEGCVDGLVFKNASFQVNEVWVSRTAFAKVRVAIRSGGAVANHKLAWIGQRIERPRRALRDHLWLLKRSAFACQQRPSRTRVLFSNESVRWPPGDFG